MQFFTVYIYFYRNFCNSQFHFTAFYFAFYCKICFLQHVISNNKSNSVKKRDFEEWNRNNIKHGGQGLLTLYTGSIFPTFQQQLTFTLLFCLVLYTVGTIPYCLLQPS
ncbi:hypothetical protein T07_5014 [Trichinella nelsoni]|uniref:Uncharacterized protein n=1 Tax=Trichinella nelsoni TaxID=6336 RepID=A0A0V0S2Y7_9BILA|nr:hypothetical protein T07_5014 [Trichinella nelsoni]